MMDVLETIRSRRSVREYADRPIPEELLDRLRAALRNAPSACNLQPWHFIFVTEPELRREVATVANDQLWMAVAPLIVVACGLPGQAYKTMAGYGNSVEIDVAIALDHLTLAAASEGLGTCWIGAFSEDPLKALLDVPDQVRIIALTPVGYPAAAAAIRPAADDRRKQPSEIFSLNRYGRK